jgi:hypothetical protein
VLRLLLFSEAESVRPSCNRKRGAWFFVRAEARAGDKETSGPARSLAESLQAQRHDFGELRGPHGRPISRPEVPGLGDGGRLAPAWQTTASRVEQPRDPAGGRTTAFTVDRAGCNARPSREAECRTPRTWRGRTRRRGRTSPRLGPRSGPLATRVRAVWSRATRRAARSRRSPGRRT